MGGKSKHGKPVRKPARNREKQMKPFTLRSDAVDAPAPEPALLPPSESAGAVLAKNLLIARQTAGLTQLELANASGVSRATIAQIESGLSDPRLSTVVDLAAAVGVSPIVLLVGREEVRALVEMPGDLATHPIKVTAPELAQMEQLVRTGMLSDRGRAARIGAAVARGAGESRPSVAVTAAIFSAFVPAGGAKAGISLGRLMDC